MDQMEENYLERIPTDYYRGLKQVYEGLTGDV
jgi:hypothetical protein